jgi:hypothetical protein
MIELNKLIVFIFINTIIKINYFYVGISKFKIKLYV